MAREIRTTFGELRQFASWVEPEPRVAAGFGFENGIIPDNAQATVDSNLAVFTPTGRGAIVEDSRADWALFCQERFGIGSALWPSFRRHPLNENFVWRPVGKGKRVLSDAEAEAYDRDGYVVVEDVLSQAFLREVVADLDHFEEARVESAKLASGKNTITQAGKVTFNVQLARHSARLRELISLPLLQHMMYDLIGPNVRLYWDQSVYKSPHSELVFPWHQDTGYTFVDQPGQIVTAWIALTDAAEDSGCMWVLPGAHRVGPLVHEKGESGNWVFESDPSGMIPLPVKAGSIVVFAGLLPHMTGGNSKSWTRKALVVEYAPDGMNRIAIDPWGEQVVSPANNPRTQFEILRDGRPVVSR
ncbi:phytanoyl-CoA dioxygenase family protein [Saccharomonospora sp. NB11]|uniref:phytanoyl-CoA dioxygenase family protein n=1 Tax=Saccharomonospora sp. NB11 TaxID=1642298 RepID=UPI0018D178E9|nr:phytanoyl-CoA dioxygenase family protein [Saccharomonospora sp. NB11]